jgi:hypothetical protein
MKLLQRWNYRLIYGVIPENVLVKNPDGGISKAQIEHIKGRDRVLNVHYVK